MTINIVMLLALMALAFTAVAVLQWRAERSADGRGDHPTTAAPHRHVIG